MGETLLVVGSVPELGSWSAASGVLMVTSAEDYPTWRSPKVQFAAADAEGTVEYKYVKAGSEGFYWEPGSNRTLALSECAGPDVESTTIQDGHFNLADKGRRSVGRMRTWSRQSTVSLDADHVATPPATPMRIATEEATLEPAKLEESRGASGETAETQPESKVEGSGTTGETEETQWQAKFEERQQALAQKDERIQKLAAEVEDLKIKHVDSDRLRAELHSERLDRARSRVRKSEKTRDRSRELQMTRQKTAELEAEVQRAKARELEIQKEVAAKLEAELAKAQAAKAEADKLKAELEREKRERAQSRTRRRSRSSLDFVELPKLEVPMESAEQERSAETEPAKHEGSADQESWQALGGMPEDVKTVCDASGQLAKASDYYAQAAEAVRQASTLEAQAAESLLQAQRLEESLGEVDAQFFPIATPEDLQRSGTCESANSTVDIERAGTCESTVSTVADEGEARKQSRLSEQAAAERKRHQELSLEGQHLRQQLRSLQEPRKPRPILLSCGMLMLLATGLLAMRPAREVLSGNKTMSEFASEMGDHEAVSYLRSSVSQGYDCSASMLQECSSSVQRFYKWLAGEPEVRRRRLRTR